MSESPPKLPEPLSFEDAMERLEEIVSGMEGDRLPLEEMVGAYEEGARLLKVCRARIESARQRVELITTRLDEPSATTLTPFDPAAAEAATPDESSRPAAARSSSARRSTTSSSKPASSDDEDIRLF